MDLKEAHHVIFFIGEPRPRKVIEEIADKTKTIKTITLKKSDDTVHPKLVALKTSDKHLINIRQILKFTNATPIRRHAGIGYACCYCAEQYPEPSNLKTHTIQTHKNSTDASFMNVKLADYVVKLDITHLTCNVCNTAINTLEELMKHLKDEHKKNMFMNIPNHIVPFKFDTDVLTCFMCSNVFNKFKMLLAHMHTHYRNYICDVCDAGFVNQHGIMNHRSSHKSGKFTCQYCPKVFKNESYKRRHERVVHILSNMIHKCPYCNDKFYNTKFKYLHIAKVHGIKLNENLKCKACDKVFKSHDRLNIHTKRDHLLERAHQCTECNKAFFSKTMLTEHMVCHVVTKEFKCDVCLKTYARKKTLTEHMRIHNDDRRFKCEHCGQAFVQKCSWKGHMRSKHGEEV